MTTNKNEKQTEIRIIEKILASHSNSCDNGDHVIRQRENKDVFNMIAVEILKELKIK